MGIGPPPTDQVPVPAEQRLGPAEELGAVLTVEKPTQTGEYSLVAGSQNRANHLTTEYGDRLAKHDDLDRQLLVAASHEPGKLEHLDEG
jgi:hypothetical protein